MNGAAPALRFDGKSVVVTGVGRAGQVGEVVAKEFAKRGAAVAIIDRDGAGAEILAAAMRAAVLGRGSAGVYNLAGPGQMTVKRLAEELGWYSIPVPELAVDAVAEMIGRLGFLPAQVQWISAFREPVIMSTAKARRELGWRPKHDALHTLRETITATRMDSLIR